MMCYVFILMSYEFSKYQESEVNFHRNTIDSSGSHFSQWVGYFPKLDILRYNCSYSIFKDILYFGFSHWN